MKMNFFLQLFVLCYSLGMGSLIFLVLAETIVTRFPNTMFSKWWRKNWVSDDDLEK